MKIAYFTDLFLPQLNGVVTSLVTITSELGARGHDIVIFAPKPKKIQQLTWKTDKVKVRLLHSMPTFIYPDFRAATPVSPETLTQIKEFQPDIIHFQTTFLVGGGGLILAKLLKKPIIGSFHGYFMEPEYLKIIKITGFRDLIGGMLWNYAAFFYNQCDTVLTYSEEAKNDLKRHKITKPIYVIPNSINGKKIQFASADAVSKLRVKYKLGEQVLIFVGRLSVEKSIDVLITCFKEVLAQKPNTSLLIVGDGPKLKDLKALSEELGIERQVVFTGKISQEDLLTKGYYQVADMFATASTSEVLPVTLIEAMYFGLPLIGIDKRGVGAMVKNVGLLCSSNHPDGLIQNIVRVLNNKTLFEQLKLKSRKAYEEKYTLESIADQYEVLYTSVIKNFTNRKQRSFFNFTKNA